MATCDARQDTDVVLRPVYHSRIGSSHANSNNHYAWAPFLVHRCSDTGDHVVAVDPEWHASLIPATKAALAEGAAARKAVVRLEPVAVPHAVQFGGDAEVGCGEDEAAVEVERLCWFVYAVFVHQYDQHVWSDGCYRLSHEELQLLAAAATRKLVTDTERTEEEEQRLACLTEALGDAAGRVSASGKLFVKLSCTSGKNDAGYENEPFVAARPRQVAVHLITNREFLKAYEKCLGYQRAWDVAVCFQPWAAGLQSHNEFRVFVYHNRVTGVAQQKWYELLRFDHDLRSIAQAIDAAYNGTLGDAVRVYRDVVLDVWVDGDLRVHLIECNSWGPAFASGSSLFHWLDDYDKLHNTDGKLHVKYLSCCINTDAPSLFGQTG
eukprot:Rhum_TRINITY_DN9511_c0_g1::Rhum_TRINITY_DN9511_c0_g1_i1::g.33861::m.33861